MQPEYDPLLRDQVIRLMGVLRRLGVARNRPIRNMASFNRGLWLGEAQDHGALQIPDGPGAELLRVPRIPLENEPDAPPALRGWLTTSSGSGEPRTPTLRSRGRLDGRQVDLVEAPESNLSPTAGMRTTWRPWPDWQRAAGRASGSSRRCSI
jgi:hypothetical protein